MTEYLGWFHSCRGTFFNQPTPSFDLFFFFIEMEAVSGSHISTPNKDNTYCYSSFFLSFPVSYTTLTFRERECMCMRVCVCEKESVCVCAERVYLQKIDTAEEE